MSGNGIYACDSVSNYKIPYSGGQSYYAPIDSMYTSYSSGGANPYGSEAWTYLNLASVKSAYLWDAKFATNNSNFHTLYSGAPYSSVHVYPGPKTYFNVENSYSYRNCLGGPISVDALNARINNIAAGASIGAYSGQINSLLSNIMGMSGWTKSKFLSEESKAQAQAIVDRCNNYASTYKTYVKNEEGLSPDNVNAMLASLLEEIKAFDLEVKALDEQLKVEMQEAQAAKADELASEAGSGGGSLGSGSSSVSTVEGDSKMSTAQLATRYDIKAPVITELSGAYAANITNAAGSRGSFTTALTALDNKNTASFLVSLSEQDIEDFCEDIDGQSWACWNDDDEISMKEFLAKFDGALDLLRKSGFLTKSEYDDACKLVADAKRQVKDSFEDSERDKVVSDLQALRKILIATVDGEEFVKGSQEHFDSLVKTKQGDEQTKAMKEFRKSYANSTRNSENPVTFDESATYSNLPEEISYLPNKDVFQVKIEGKVFQGKDFSDINRKIMKCKDENVIMSWLEIKKEIIKTSTDS